MEHMTLRSIIQHAKKAVKAEECGRELTQAEAFFFRSVFADHLASRQVCRAGIAANVNARRWKQLARLEGDEEEALCIIVRVVEEYIERSIRYHEAIGGICYEVAQ